MSLYPRGIGANGAVFGRDRVAWATGAGGGANPKGLAFVDTELSGVGLFCCAG